MLKVKKDRRRRGFFSEHYDPVAQGYFYQAGGAHCLSVLTDEQFFFGSLDDLIAVRAAVDLPIIRKDFIIDPRQIAQARLVGADCVLLIMACLEDGLARDLYGFSKEIGLDVLVEVHDASEAARAVALEADMIGVNNRNLNDFSVSLATTFELLPGLLAADRVVVSESGITDREQCVQLEAAGVDAILVGETLMQAGDPANALRQLRTISRMTRVKICGFTTKEDCQAAVSAGVDAFGFNFAAGPRKITPARGRAFVAALPPFVQSVGLFLNQPPLQVREVMRATGCQVIQLHGEERPEEIRWLARFFMVIKAYRIRTAADIAAIPTDLPVAAVLLDAWSDQAHGGTGEAWDYAALHPNKLPYPLILAGGLRPENVGAAVRAVRPYAIDAASGVESAPGRKSAVLMQRMVTAVRAAAL